MAVAAAEAIGGAVVVVKGVNKLLDESGKIWGTVDEFLHSGRGRHNLMEGIPKPGDVVLKQSYRRPKGILPKFQKEEFVYQCKANETITAIVAKDHWDDDTGGEAKIISGGPGQNHVKLVVTSQMGRGFEFTVIIYGKRR